MFDFTPTATYIRKKTPELKLNSRLSAFLSPSGHFGEGNPLSLPGVEPAPLCPSA
jgi:hypothetical protein